MVAVLLAPARIAAGGLDVAVRIGADPHVGVGGRDGQGADAVDGGGVPHRLAVRPDVVEAQLGGDAADARIVIGDVGQAVDLGRRRRSQAMAVARHDRNSLNEER